MGAVYLARQAALGGRRVAVKEMFAHLPDPGDRLRASEQFCEEARLLASIEHPGVVDVKDFFEENGSHYLVMTFIDGRTLDEVTNDAPPFLRLEQVLDWGDQICDVLERLHTNDPPVLVRDLKPSNLMVDGQGRIRLIDFGIARVFEPEGQTKAFLKGAGTAGFAPVEQYGNGTTDPRTDVYALGATLYATLTRTLPPWSVSLATGEAALTPPSAINPGIPPAVEAVILRMMALKKDDRFGTAAEARTALREARSAPAPPKPAPVPRFCVACGSTLVPAARACVRCGQMIDAPLPARFDNPQAAVATLPPTTIPPIPWTPPPRPKSSTPTVVTVVVLVAVLALLAWSPWKLPKPSASPSASPSGISGTWRGTLHGNDPNVAIQVIFTQSGDDVSGLLTWDSPQSGVHQRRIAGSYQNGEYVLHDVALVGATPAGNFRFCAVDCYVLQRRVSDELTGTFQSGECNDAGDLSLLRR